MDYLSHEPKRNEEILEELVYCLLIYLLSVHRSYPVALIEFLYLLLFCILSEVHVMIHMRK